MVFLNEISEKEINKRQFADYSNKAKSFNFICFFIFTMHINYG